MNDYWNIQTDNNVTVLMPVYNNALYLSNAIKSILRGSFTAFELLIIDDASDDNSVSIIESFSDTRIRLIKNERREGIVSVLNKGIDLANYELIARMNPEDISHPWRLEKQVAYMLLNVDCAILASFVRIMNKDGEYLYTTGIHGKFFYYLIHFENFPHSSALIFRKKHVVEIGKYSENDSDINLCVRLSKRFKIWSIDEPLVNCRVYEKRLLENSNSSLVKDQFQNSLCVYPGEIEKIPEIFAECYRNNFDEITKDRDLNIINECLLMFDAISANILSFENPNRDMYQINYCWQEKKKFMVGEIALRLPYKKMIALLWQQNQKILLLKITLRKMKTGIKSLFIKKN